MFVWKDYSPRIIIPTSQSWFFESLISPIHVWVFFFNLLIALQLVRVFKSHTDFAIYVQVPLFCLFFFNSYFCLIIDSFMMKLNCLYRMISNIIMLVIMKVLCFVFIIESMLVILLLSFNDSVLFPRNCQEWEKLLEDLHLRSTCQTDFFTNHQPHYLCVKISLKFLSNSLIQPQNSQTLNTKSKIIYIPALLSPKLNINPSCTRYFKHTRLIKTPRHSNLYQICGMHFGFRFRWSCSWLLMEILG